MSSSSSFVDVENVLNEANSNNESKRDQDDGHLVEPIAIVGLGCRLPGGVSSVDDFWEMIINQRTGQCDFPESRFNAKAFYHPDKERPGSMNTTGGYFLQEDIRTFENSFFGINNLEATYMDPQQRKLLEVIFECFENAGARLEDLSGSNTGVYVGNFTMDFQVMQTRDPEYLHRYSATGMGTTILSNRISHVFNLHGPSLVLDTACSSSLHCLHTAVMALRNGECDAAVAAGVNLIQSPEQHIGTMKAGVLSKSSTCHTFSDAADGYGRADGVGAIYVKRLSDAIANKDPIRAVIRGTALNANGKTPGITQPSPIGQEAVVRKAHAQAGLSLDETSYVEAHGTGTPVGDPIETLALARAFSSRSKDTSLLVGSVKPNFGHSEAASGISSIIKVCLALERGVIPPTANVGRLNPDIKTYEWNMEIVTRNTPWPRDGSGLPRRAGINSFGYGGANVHMVLEAADTFLPPGYLEDAVPTKVLQLLDKKFILPFSATSSEALNARVTSLQDSAINLVNLAYTLTSRRTKLPLGGYLIASQRQLENSFSPENLNVLSSGSPSLGSEGFTFVFTGQGAQWAEMGKGLIEQYASFRATIKQFDAVLKGLKHPPPWTIMDALTQPAEISKINEVTRSQPACTALQIAIVDLLASWGIEPSAVIGHSSGEIAAAYAAGLITSSEAIVIAYYRGYVVQKLTIKGQMMAIGLSKDDAQAEIERCGLVKKIVVACVNSPENVTLSGDADAIDTFYTSLASSNVLQRKLLTDGRAYHSRHMCEVGEEYELLLRESCKLEHYSPRVHGNVHWLSSVLLEPMTRSVDVSYWRHNLERPVLFEPAIQALSKTHSIPLIEIGPHGALKLPIKQIKDKHGISSMPYFQALKRGESSEISLLKVVGNLYLSGATINLNCVNSLSDVAGTKDLVVVGKVSKSLPTYRWSYDTMLWNEPRASAEFRNRQYHRHELLGSLICGGNLVDYTWRNLLNASDVPWIRDHKLDNTIVFPAAGYIAMAIEALSQALGRHSRDGGSFKLRDVNIMTALALSSHDRSFPVELFTALKKRNISGIARSKKWWEFEMVSVRDGQSTTHATGSIMLDSPDTKILSTLAIDEHIMELSAVRNWYQKMKQEGLNFGPYFQTMKQLRIPRGRKDRHAISELDLLRKTPGAVEADSDYVIHPLSIDGMLQTAIIAGAHGVIPGLLGQVPVAFEHAIIRAPVSVEPSTGYVAHADSMATSFSSATISTELYAPKGQLQAQIKNMRLATYQGSASKESVTERHPMLRVCWKPDLATVLAAPAAFQAFIERQTVPERPETNSCIANRINEMLSILRLACHKNPRSRILYLITDEHDIEMVEMCLTELESGLDFQSYGSFVVGELTKEGIINKKQLFNAASLQQLRSLSNLQGNLLFDVVISPESLGDGEPIEHVKSALDLHGWLVLLGNNKNFIPNLRNKASGTNDWGVCNFSTTSIISKRPSDSLKNFRCQSLVVVEQEIGSALGDAIVLYASQIAESVTRLSQADITPNAIPHKSTVISTIEAKEPFLSIMDEEEMKILKTITDMATNVVWVTSAGMLDGTSPDMTLVGGLSRSLMLEQPSLSFYTLDTDRHTQPQETAEHILSILTQSMFSSILDYEFVEKDGLLHISRFVPDEDYNTKFQQRQGKYATQMALEEAGTATLHLQAPGQLHSLCFKQESERTELAKDHIEIEVMAQSINGKDVQVLSGKSETRQATVAGEYTGIVKAVGSSVTDFSLGDRVAVMAPNRFGLVEQAPIWACQKLCSNESFTALSTIFVEYATAIHALHECARVQSGDTVLVHVDAAGIGLATARIASLAGAKVLCTVSSTQDRETLISSYGFDPRNIFVLDDASYLTSILEATDNQGVDIVVNSLEGDLLHEGWEACAEFGRFVDIGTREITNAGSLDMSFFSKQLTFTSFNLENLFYHNTKKTQQKWSSLMDRVLTMYRQNLIQAIEPLKIFDASEIAEAYQYVSASTSIGKVAISLENPHSLISVLPFKYSTLFSPTKAYFLIGCLGGLGASLAKWMLSRGARRFVFLGRSGADRPVARRLVEDLRSLGATVSVYRGDVANMTEVQTAIDSIDGVLGGVVQAAMGLSEALFTNMSNEAWHTGIGPKLRGTWNLHHGIAQREAKDGLDFFLLTSSVSGSVGTATESNYCAANHFLDSFARYRRAMGLPATSLGLGMISEVGYLHENPEIEELLRRKGIQAINEAELLQIVDLALSDSGNAGGKDSNSSTTKNFLTSDPLAAAHLLTGLEPQALKSIRAKGFDVSSPILSDPRASLLARSIDGISMSTSSSTAAAISAELTHALEAAPEGTELAAIVAELVKTCFCNLILVELAKVDESRPLAAYGMDSMLAAEFRTWVWKVFKFDIPFLDLLSKQTSLKDLIQSVVEDVQGRME